MAFKTVFKRYEIKYLITQEQKKMLLSVMLPYMRPDEYGRTTIRNIYYDTDSFRLIRDSIQKPVYKEKLRVRSYKTVDMDDTVFVELKKKYKSVVYKRRISLSEGEARAWLNRDISAPVKTQITDEIDYFLNYYGTLAPKVFLSYDREAFYSNTDEEFRITFDENILYRTDFLSLSREPFGEIILGEGYSLMEIKTAGGIPLWLTEVLSKNNIFKTSFSKYGNAYTDILRRSETKETLFKEETLNV